MYIPYDAISNLPILNIFKKSFYKLKIEQNCKFIEKNTKKVIEKLKTKKKLKVAFYIYDEAKWKCQSLYDLMTQDEYFEPVILVTKSSTSDINNPTYQSKEDITRVFEFFKTKNMNVEYAYDFENNKFIPFEDFQPDIIIYQHPWYVETSQGPVVCSKFALTYYVPYFVANAGYEIDYCLRFHQYIHKHCVLNEEVLRFYAKNMENGGKNLIATGHPQLDYYLLNKESVEFKYLIYAPHWSVGTNGNTAYSTFDWNGDFLLEYAKNHTELNWVFKPHPLLKKALIDSKLKTESEINRYYEDWQKIGLVHTTGDYMPVFNKSYAMITDSGSFLIEYPLTKQPIIHLISEFSAPFCEISQNLIKNYYEAKNLDELKNLLETVIIKKQDITKKQRINYLEKLGLTDNYAAKNIIDDIKRLK